MRNYFIPVVLSLAGCTSSPVLAPQLIQPNRITESIKVKGTMDKRIILALKSSVNGGENLEYAIRMADKSPCIQLLVPAMHSQDVSKIVDKLRLQEVPIHGIGLSGVVSGEQSYDSVNALVCFAQQGVKDDLPKINARIKDSNNLMDLLNESGEKVPSSLRDGLKLSANFLDHLLLFDESHINSVGYRHSPALDALAGLDGSIRLFGLDDINALKFSVNCGVMYHTKVKWDLLDAVGTLVFDNYLETMQSEKVGEAASKIFFWLETRKEQYQTCYLAARSKFPNEFVQGYLNLTRSDQATLVNQMQSLRVNAWGVPEEFKTKRGVFIMVGHSQLQKKYANNCSARGLSYVRVPMK